MAQKYESKVFSNVSRVVECLLDSGNTTTPGVAISQQLANDLGLTIVPYHTPVRNVDGGVCAIVGTVAPQNLTISFLTSDQESKEFEIQLLVLQKMPDHVNIGISFMRQLKLQINYDEVMDEIWSPFLGHLVEGSLMHVGGGWYPQVLEH